MQLKNCSIGLNIILLYFILFYLQVLNFKIVLNLQNTQHLLN